MRSRLHICTLLVRSNGINVTLRVVNGTVLPVEPSSCFNMDQVVNVYFVEAGTFANPLRLRRLETNDNFYEHNSTARNRSRAIDQSPARYLFR